MAKAQIDQIKTFINAGRYREARIALKNLEHPKKAEWLERLNSLEQAKLAAIPGAAPKAPAPAKVAKQSAGITVKLPTQSDTFREKALFRDATFTITGEHVIIQDAVYPLRQINSAQVCESAMMQTDAKPGMMSRLGELARKLKPGQSGQSYVLRLGFHTVEEDAFMSTDRRYMTQIVEHINTALVQTSSRKSSRNS